MSRFIGSLTKKSRRYGFSILENGKEFSKGKKRTYAPGQHGQKRIKLSDYGLQLKEKQKVKFMYGLNERQMINTFKKARKIKKGILGTNFLISLESRLDNIVYRLGLSNTRNGARQLVNHGHILVNNKKVDIPSYSCKIGDLISLKEKTRKNTKVTDSLKLIASTLDFVEFDKVNFTGKYKRLPERSELNNEIQESLIVELYNRTI